MLRSIETIEFAGNDKQSVFALFLFFSHSSDSSSRSRDTIYNMVLGQQPQQHIVEMIQSTITP
jgi:hypothetical protein